MKLVHFVLFCFGFTNLVNAQVSFMFPDSNAIWSYYFQNNHAPGSPPTYDYHTLHYALFNEDTVINDTVYKKLFKTFDSSFHENFPSVSGEQIRIEGSRVYYRPKNNPCPSINEYLLYDFSMKAGDTINYFSNYGLSNRIICESIDSVLISGRFHKRWLIVCPETWFWNYWIEGIGSDFHLLSTYQPFFSVDFDFFELLCFEQDSILIYENTLNPDYDSNCHAEGHWPPWGIEETKMEQTKISVVPNPVESKSIIEFENIKGNPAEVHIFNAMGQLVKTYNNINEELSIYNKNYQKGFYFVKGIVGQQVITTKFIIY